MVLAMTLNLMLAALMGVLIPMTMLKFGRDPAVGLVGADHGGAPTRAASSSFSGSRRVFLV